MVTTVQPVPAYALPFIGNEQEMRKLGLKFNPLWLKWFLDMLKTIQSGGGVDHNLLSNLQGGTTNQYYHLRAPGGAGQIVRSDGSAWLGTTATYPNTASAGDIIRASASNTLGGLTVGTVGKVLQSDGSFPIWSTFAFPTTAARGDMIYASAANTWSNRTIGTVGKILRSDGTDPQWTTATRLNTLTADQLLYASSTNVEAQSSGMTFTGGDTFTATKIVGSTSITNSSLTSGRVTFSGASGIQSDAAGFTFADPTLSVKQLAAAKTTAGEVITFTNAAANNKTGYLYSSAQFVALSTGTTAGGQSLLMDATNSLVYINPSSGLSLFTMSTTGVQLFSATPSFGSGTYVLGVTDASVNPSTNPSGGGALYSSGGGGVWRGSGGTVTTFAPT